MKILAIETSCDETAIALLEANGGLKNPRFKILKNLVASQIKIHQPFGGVVPNLAKREHLKNLPILFGKIFPIFNYQLSIFNQFSISQLSKLKTIDLIAVTVGPGLEPALWTGVNFAKDLYKELKNKNKKIKLIGASHLEGHLYSNILENVGIDKVKNIFPAVALIISGGHTILIIMESFSKYKKIGETRDDAVGEAFDKVARLLNLPYPGGPEIEKLAKMSNPNAINFPRPMLNQKNYDFSFSGLKTAVLYYLRNLENSENLSLKKVSRSQSGHGILRSKMSEGEKQGASETLVSETPSFFEINLSDVAASFQKAAFDVLIKKTLRVAEEFKAKSIFISGGVASNKNLQKEFKKAIKIIDKNKRGLTRIIPKLYITKFPTDNAAMIAAAGYMNFLRKKNKRLMAKGDLTI